MTFPSVDQKAWRARVEAELAGEGFEASLVTRTLEGLPLQPLYGPDDRPRFDAGLPGTAPYVRGARAASGRRWKIAAALGHPHAGGAAREAQEALAAGADALVLPLDRAGRLGFAPHNASNTVGVGGVSLLDRGDLAEVLAGVDLTRVTVALDAGANALPTAALYVSELWSRDTVSEAARGHFGADAHAALARDGALPGDLDDARRELIDLTVFSRIHYEHVRSLAVDARHWHRTGADVVQELGLALAGFVETLRWLQDELPPAAAAAEVVFRVDVGRDLLTEVAKLRALRLLYSKVMTAAGVPVPPPPVVHAFTSPRGLTARDPHTNLVRVTLGTFAAAVGGADLVTAMPFDAAVAGALPSQLARRLALTTQHVLAEECHLHHVADPLGGAYHMEARTLELARAGFVAMQDIERRGGLARCLVDGYVGETLAASREALFSAVRRRKRALTGVSEFPLQSERCAEPSTEHADARRAAVERSTARANRGGRMVLGDLQSFAHAAEAAERGATLAELASALVRGAPLERAPLPEVREAAPFEALRDAADRAPAPPRVFLACLGSLAEHGPRAQFAANLFAAGGFEVIQGSGTAALAPEEAARALVAAHAESRASVVCLCGSDGAYSSHAIAALGALHSTARGAANGVGARWIVYAGRPRHTEHEHELRDVGVDAFVFAGCDAVEALSAALAAAGVLGQEVRV